MLRAMYAGVAGLRAHQVKLDVIGNNIANVNTVGYKSSRVTFKEMLTQTLRGASQPTAGRGGLNPMQVGLGVSLGSIDNDLSQGNLQSTGKMTDLAIQGNGFFVVSDGNRSYYTRAGSFTFDTDGNLVHAPTGYKVQGWMADERGKMPNTSPSNMTTLSLGELNMAPTATSFIAYKGNLDSDKEIADLSYKPEKITVTDLSGKTANLYIKLNKIAGDTTADRGDDRWQWTAYTDISVKDETINVSGTGTPINLSASTSPDFDHIVSGTVVVTDSTGTTIYSEGIDYIIDYDNGTIEILSGGNISSGDTILVDYIHQDQVTTGEIALDATGAVLVNTTPTFNLTLRDTSGATRDVEIKAPQVGQENGGYFAVSDTVTDVSASTIDGTYGPVKTTSTTVYDSLGNKHTINLSFVKTGQNRWDWFATGPVDENGNPLSLSGNTGTIQFDAHGKIMGESTGGPITFQPADAEKVVINLDFSDVTQFAADDSVNVADVDGFEAGSLESFSIDATGTIIGYYSNGLNQPIAKLAIATFSNAAGLERVGDTVFMESKNSGMADIGLSGVGGKGMVSSGTLEMSNVDLADEFTEMITTQRGFQASSKIITTADQILQDLVNLKR
ncbi:hypothetical protein BBF96_11020 [Anoxybacter fermentans]|uniref:Flagellar hook protein FlgE n=1 Tax=Anoxybacter fermentans TaxID=1323375 RepID=A0A3S9T0C3_9FIRM|nr:flagellar hook protein FlgE [Anoxybacter fermentans]AZR73872.1 hypothetical protein BBF96_11020 [Anoxybacter fermentans]